MSLNDFEFGKELGKGAFGSVTIVKRLEDNKIYAMKRVKIGRLGKKEKDNSFNEVRLLASLDHKNIIGYKEAFFDDRSKTLNIVMEYADGGDLSTKIKEYKRKNLYFEEEEIWSTLIQILEGLKYLHQSSIIHRDLKSANIFLTKNGCVKIGDLNVSKILNRMRTASTQTGTPYFASPEIWNDQPYDYKCDIWSVGCIIYEMAALHVPFRGTSMQNLYQNVLRGSYQQISLRYSEDLRKIIKQILIVNPRNRPSSSELLENPIIKHKMIELGMNTNIKKKDDEKARLMKTIKIPMNLSQINNELPQKKYEKEKMLLNDEYETAKKTFYHPPTINNENVNNNNDGEIDNNLNDKQGIINNNQKYNNNCLNHKEKKILLNKQLEDKNYVEKLLEKDLNNIQNIIKNIDNINSKNNNYLLNNKNQKLFQNIDNNSISLNSKKISDNNSYKRIEIAEPYLINPKNNPKINLDNRIIKTDLNQITPNNLNIPYSKKEEIIKTEISNIDTNSKNNENKIIQNFEKEKQENINFSNSIKNAENENINKNNVNQNNMQDNDFKEQYYKLMEEIRLKNENKLVENNNINPIIKEQNRNNYLCLRERDKNINVLREMRIKDIDEEILKSKKELEEIDKNLNLLEQKRKSKKELKYNKSENILNPNIKIDINNYENFREDKNKINKIQKEVNLTENHDIIKKESVKLQNEGKQIKKINNKIFEMNVKNIRNNKQQYIKNNANLRPNLNSNYIKNERSSLNLNNKYSINKINNKNINENNNNNSNRYNIFINYKNNKNYPNYNNNYHFRNNNNYYFNNCNFINNNLNDNNNIYHNKYEHYNNNYLGNPYKNNYYNNYNQFYKDYFNNFINYLSLKKQKEENNHNILNNKYDNEHDNKPENKKAENNNNYSKPNDYEKPYIISNKFKINDLIEDNNKRKIIYEKIDYQKQGNKYKYFKGPTQIRYVGNGNYYNQCHKAIIKNPIIINPAKQYGIQNLFSSVDKQNKSGPRIILPKNMF